jgi:hypothetical protein
VRAPSGVWITPDISLLLLDNNDEVNKMTDQSIETAARVDPQAKSAHFLDYNGNPAGGSSFGRGYDITWQKGPLGQGADRVEPNGAFVETVLRACLDRMNFYQTTKFNSEANALIIQHIESAIKACQARTADRIRRNVEGVHKE